MSHNGAPTGLEDQAVEGVRNWVLMNRALASRHRGYRIALPRQRASHRMVTEFGPLALGPTPS